MKTIGFMVLPVVALGLSLPRALASGNEYLVYFGTYTRGESQGIYVSRFDVRTGKLTSAVLAAESRNPAFLAVHPNRRFLYAVGESEGPDGVVRAFEIDPRSGKLTLLNQVSSRGAGPCHLNVDRTGRSLVVANYRGGSIAACRVLANGSLAEASSFVQHAGSSVNPRRQEGPHAHSVNFSPDNHFVVAADLGLDQLLVYRFDPERASLVAHDPAFVRVPPGGGPRHFTFHPNGMHAYVINELQSTVTAFSYEAQHGRFEATQTISTLPEDFSGTNTTAEVLAHPSGQYLYGSNRGHDSIAVFAIDPQQGSLVPIERVSTQGKTPRNFRIDPTGSYLLAANQNSHSVVVFKIDAGTGRLTPTGQVLEVFSPVCIRFVPLGE